MTTAFNEKTIKRLIVVTLKRLYERKLISALSGNISVRIPGTGYVWITPSGLHKADVGVEDLVKIDLDGNIVEGSRRPSMEWRFHVAIYRARPNVNAVIHSHNPYVMALDIMNIELDIGLLVESKYFVKGVAYIPEAEPGSEELARFVAEAVSGNVDVNALVLKRHGVVSMGRDIAEAEAIVEALEDVARAQLYTLMSKCLQQIDSAPKSP